MWYTITIHTTPGWIYLLYRRERWTRENQSVMGRHNMLKMSHSAVVCGWNACCRSLVHSRLHVFRVCVCSWYNDGKAYQVGVLDGIAFVLQYRFIPGFCCCFAAVFHCCCYCSCCFVQFSYFALSVFPIGWVMLVLLHTYSKCAALIVGLCAVWRIQYTMCAVYDVWCLPRSYHKPKHMTSVLRCIREPGQPTHTFCLCAR